jgi:hypothetical protein
MIDNFLLEPDEAESELYLLCARLFENFDKDKSSIIPYLRSHIPWKAHHLIRKLTKYHRREDTCGLTMLPEELDMIHEEYYWRVPDVLIIDKFVGKLFTRDQKYLISKILMSEDNKLTTKDLAISCGVSRPTMIDRLSDLKESLKYWRI